MKDSAKLVALCAYASGFIIFTVVVGSVLRSRGRVFLAHTFRARPEVADAVHSLLNLGFYLTCLGLLLINVGFTPEASSSLPFSLLDASQSAAARLGSSIFVVAFFHIANVLILSVLNRTNSREGQ